MSKNKTDKEVPKAKGTQKKGNKDAEPKATTITCCILFTP